MASSPACSRRMGDETVIERILNGDEDSKDLPLPLLQRITDDFSEERKIGDGGFGAVYKGVLRNGIIVAVKRIYVNIHTIDDKPFRREFNSLRKINHQNVVRFLGFCSNTYQTSIEEAGSEEVNLANVRERLLCFEYISNGSLDKYITDELRGLEWETRYEIIIGICNGLRYLHEEKSIVHMDLKPANILLDGTYMIPKITDFGLSRSNKNTHTMGLRFGTRGYLAPEYENSGKTSFSSDIYSLGAIIIELVTGCIGVPSKNNVLRRWRHRWNKPPTLLQYQQVTRCIDIAVSCREQKPEARPSISEIISFLGKCESTGVHTGQISSRFDEDDVLGIKPLELRLPCELKKEISCLVELINNTSKCTAFNIQPPSLKRYNAQPDKGVVRPLSKYGVNIMVHPQDMHYSDKFIVRSMKVSEALRDEDITERMFEEASEVVDEVNLMVVYDPVKSMKNFRSREDTNMPAEEVPKDINSSVQGQCTKQTKQCNFYPPQSFSRQSPTNMTYLGKESDRAVDFARGAMGSLLDKLGKLVKEDYNLETSMKRDIESFSEDLMMMHQDLRNLKQLNGVNIWVDEVREMSYHIEDIVDGFLVHVEPDSNRSDFKDLTHESLKFLKNSMMTRHQIGDVIRDIKNKVQAVANRGKKYNFDVSNVVANTTTEDIRISAMYEDNEQLIGIEAPRDELIRLFKEDGDISMLKTVSIVGLGGLGKTTFAKAVYDKLKAHYHQIGDVIRDIKNKVQAVANRGKKYNFDVNNVVANATTVDIRISAIYEDNEQLIGIEAPRDELTRLFKEDGDVSKLKTVSIVGLGGLGKTTLAKAVYDKLKAHYHPKAFVPVGQNPDVKITLKKIIIDCQSQEYNAAKLEYLDARGLINELRKLLEDKRYFIVIDDIWDSSSWDLITSAFPKNNHGSIVITTTRIERVARDCCKVESKYIYWMKALSVEDSRRLFLRRVFGPGKDCPDAQKGISTDILKKCDGMPLAINSIASLLAGEPESTWDYVRKTLGAMTEGDDHEKMKQILDLSYKHLPDHLQTCMLYVCMYPEDREIDKDDLLGKWIAEGFVHVSKNSRLDAEDVAEKYFKELISMCMIQPGKLDVYSNEVLSCRVHDIILDLMRSKSTKENFIHVIDVSKDETGACGQIHRVSVEYDRKKDMRVLEPINKGSLSHVRSVLLYRSSDVPCFLEFKYVRVLHLELTDYSNKGLDLTSISGLFLLRYLKVTAVYGIDYELKLPNKIGELQQLETIDLDQVVLKKLPSDVVSLPWLSHFSLTGLFGSSTGIALPDGIERLKSMRTLEGVDIVESSVENIKGIRKLTKLRVLHILLGGIDRPRVDALHSSICGLSTSLRVLRFEGRQVEVPGWGSRTLFPRGSCIRELDLRGCKFERCPKWIGQLQHLYKFIIMVREVADGVSIVAGLPSLSCFKLLIDTRLSEKRESVVIPGGGAFKALKHLTFFCKHVELTFQAGAMPKLEKLQILFRYGVKARSVPVGIRYLPAGIVKYIWLSVACAYNPYQEYEPYSSAWLPDEYAASLRQHNRVARALLMDAFKPHHPDADIRICFDEGVSGDEGDDRKQYGDPWV